jgi:hypothetical protein
MVLMRPRVLVQAGAGVKQRLSRSIADSAATGSPCTIVCCVSAAPLARAASLADERHREPGREG